MFAITPRLSNSRPFLELMGDLVDPFCRPANNHLVLYQDGSSGLPNGRLGDSQVQNTDKEFRIRLDLSHYSPEEVKITSDDSKISIHAKHEERQDGHGFVSRELKRTYKLPNDVDPNSATSTMNDNGTLSIKIAKRAPEAQKETVIPVEFKSKK